MAYRKTDSPLQSKVAPARPDFALEEERMARGARCVAGVDEAGRGPLAGPVVAAAVILDAANIPDGLNDSKQLDMAERERLFAEIMRFATVCVASSSAAEIDRINIRQATLLAMRRAFDGLSRPACHVLVDGRDVPPSFALRGTAVRSWRSSAIMSGAVPAEVGWVVIGGSCSKRQAFCRLRRKVFLRLIT